MHKMTFKTPLAIAVATASLGLCGVANADTTMEERFAELEARIAAAEQRAEAAERRA
ncbi:MAG TPA: porin, partial [Halomonas sp.]|nr:porin [Halomonas sp.]HCL23131.1 porin [Halomonas sp.]